MDKMKKNQIKISVTPKTPFPQLIWGDIAAIINGEIFFLNEYDNLMIQWIDHDLELCMLKRENAYAREQWIDFEEICRIGRAAYTTLRKLK
jgi:hypothetical protein